MSGGRIDERDEHNDQSAGLWQVSCDEPRQFGIDLLSEQQGDETARHAHRDGQGEAHGGQGRRRRRTSDMGAATLDRRFKHDPKVFNPVLVDCIQTSIQIRFCGGPE